jgi:hypothetical protein
MSTRHGPFAARRALGEPNAVRAAREVMIALFLAIQRVNGTDTKGAVTPLVMSVLTVPPQLLRMGFEILLALL